MVNYLAIISLIVMGALAFFFIFWARKESEKIKGGKHGKTQEQKLLSKLK